MATHLNLRRRAELKLPRIAFNTSERCCENKLLSTRVKNLLRDGFSVF